MSTTRVLAGDLSASLSFFLATELISAFTHILSLSEIVVFAIAIVFVSSSLSAQIKGAKALLQSYPVLGNAAELLDVLSFLSVTTTIQIAMQLIRSTVYSPGARVVTIVSSLLLMRSVSMSVSLGRRPGPHDA